jgi:hypothetical protein
MFAEARSSRVEAWLVVLALAFCTWFFACRINFARDAAADDAFITYVYGRNLAEGHGLRYNATDAEPTAGASSTLHVAFVALAQSLGFDPLSSSRALGIACLFAIAIGFGLAGASIARAPPLSGVLAGLAVVFLFALLPETEIHLASGMETLLFAATHALVAAWAAWVAFRTGERLDLARVAIGIVVLTLLVLARPEGGWLAFGYVVALVIGRTKRHESFERQVGALAPVWVALVLVVAALLIWRKLYFGGVFANPYYVKSNNAIFGSAGAWFPGLDTTWRFFSARWLPLALLLVIVAGALGAREEQTRKAAWLLAPSSAIVVLYARAIHEMAGGFRYEYPMLVPLIGALVIGLCVLRSRSVIEFAVALVCSTCILPLLAGPTAPPLFNWLAHPRSASTSWLGANVPQNNALERLGLDLADTQLGQDATILLSAAGQIPWHSRWRAIDWVGLNDTKLSGREALSLDEVWSYIDEQHPDVVMSILPPAANAAGERLSDANFLSANVQRTLAGRGSALFESWDRERVADMFWREMRWVREHCEFGACYKLGSAWGDEWWVFAYVRRDSPHRERIQSVLANSQRADRTSNLAQLFTFDPRMLGKP